MDARNFGPTPPPDDPNGYHGPPSGTAIAIVLCALLIALVGGYFLVMKLVDMSRTEDCLMSGRRNCTPIEMPAH
jgi:hypothetical protein